jgi:hypothetical protein
MKESTDWDVYLLDWDKVNKLRKEGKLLRTMLHEEIVKLKLIGPVPIVAPANYKAKRNFFNILITQPWFSEKYQGTSIRTLLPYIYVRNKVDERVKPEFDFDSLKKDTKKHKEEILV